MPVNFWQNRQKFSGIKATSAIPLDHKGNKCRFSAKKATSLNRKMEKNDDFSGTKKAIKMIHLPLES